MIQDERASVLQRSFALIALAFGLVAAVSLIAARPVFEIFTPSDPYTATTDDLAQARYLAPGETLLVLFHGTAFKSYILLCGLSLLITSWLMLRDSRFEKAAAYVGLLGNTVSLGFLLPMIGAFFALLAMPILAVWFILLARTFLRLGRQS